MKKLKYLVSGLALFVANAAQAQGLKPPPPISGLPGDASETIGSTIVNYVEIFLAVVGVIAVAYLIFGGFRYITSAGNEEAAESGKKIIQNAIIGLIVIILSYVIITVIINAVGNEIVD